MAREPKDKLSCYFSTAMINEVKALATATGFPPSTLLTKAWNYSKAKIKSETPLLNPVEATPVKGNK